MATVRTLLATLWACTPDPTDSVEEDLGPIEDVLDDLALTVWPGVVQDNGVRHVRMVNGFFDGAPTTYWFAGFASRQSADVFWFCREDDDACPFDDQGRIDRSHTVGNPVFKRIPGEVDYSPFWLTWRVVVPDDYEPDALKSASGIEHAADAGEVRVEPVIFDHGGDIGPGRAIMHCLIVPHGTELENNGDVRLGREYEPTLYIPPQAGWHKQYSLEFYDFSLSEGTFAPADDTQSLPLMRIANIFVFFRDCENGSTAPSCGATSAELGAVSERGVEIDLTGDGDKADNNNIISGFPHTPSSNPGDLPYSPLWQVNRVRIPVEHDDDVVLIDNSMDQNVTVAKDIPSIYDLVDQGLALEPEPLKETLFGNQIPGNDGRLMFNCPSQILDE